jgi:prepilin-type N-terminal cleavage/methylation domain-containing protein
MIARLSSRNKKGFTILELMISMTLFALIITSVIVAVENLMIARTKTLNRVALLEELYFFSEQLFTGIKDGGTLDYEEYWNRKAVGVTTQSGHYMVLTGIGNYGSWGNVAGGTSVYGTGVYLCRSNNWTSMGTGGCLSDNNNGWFNNQAGSPLNFSGSAQRYGEYLAQFTDYNGNTDNDNGNPGNEDEDVSGSIIWDDDDRATGDAPEVLTGSIRELYLINKTAKRRTYFRWNIEQDTNNTSITCVITTTGSGKITTGSGCIGNVQVLKLKWLDIGINHDGTTVTAYDGIIDTWACVESGQCKWPTFGTDQLATGTGAEWINLFPSTINVKNLSFQIYPVKDPWLSWSAQDCSIATCISPFIHPYVRMNLEMWFSAAKRLTLQNTDPTISIATSISLSDFE